MSDTTSSPSQPAALAGSPDTDADDSQGPEQGGRGLLARLIDVFSPSEDTAPRDAAPMTPMPGMSNLRRMRVEDVSVPKTEIVAAPVAGSFDDLVQVFRDSGMSRIPVYDGTLDTPLGMVNLKDLALRHGFNGPPDDFDLRAMLRPLLYVPPSMPLAVLLQKMQTERIHMALVIDEYGGTDGLVTIEDLLETVVGEIEDEHDEDEAATFVRERDGVWVAQATTPLEEFEAEIGMDLTAHDDIDEEEVDTLGGLVFMLAGHVPARGEIVPHPDGPEFEVIDADPRRIKRLRVRMKPRATDG